MYFFFPQERSLLYRGGLTVKDSYPLPRIDECLLLAMQLYFQRWTATAGIGKYQSPKPTETKPHSHATRAATVSNGCPSGCVMPPPRSKGRSISSLLDFDGSHVWFTLTTLSSSLGLSRTISGTSARYSPF